METGLTKVAPDTVASGKKNKNKKKKHNRPQHKDILKYCDKA